MIYSIDISSITFYDNKRINKKGNFNFSEYAIMNIPFYFSNRKTYSFPIIISIKTVSHSNDIASNTHILYYYFFHIWTPWPNVSKENNGEESL